MWPILEKVTGALETIYAVVGGRSSLWMSFTLVFLVVLNSLIPLLSVCLFVLSIIDSGVY